MQITAQSEWMEDQMHAVVMAPGKAFQVIQAKSGGSIFFSLGSDGILYATREVQASTTGWDRLDLSSHLSSLHDGDKVKVKSFCVAQNQQSLAFDLAIVITTAKSSTDYLYLSLGNDDADNAWTSLDGSPRVRWVEAPFDDTGRDSITIDNVYLVNLPSPGKLLGSQTCFVDILKGTPKTNTMRLLDRYYIALDGPGQMKWVKRTLAIDLKAGSISCCLGRPEGQLVGGIYTLGKIEDRVELTFAPSFNPFDPSVPPNPVRLQVPSSASSIASTLNDEGRSALFLSADQGIYAFAADEQYDQAEPKLVLSLDVVRQATQLQACTTGNVTAVYGISVQGELFYATCRAGKELRPEAWSVPVTLASDIQRFAFYLNTKAGDNTVFAHAQGRQLFQLTQDVVTRNWASRSVLLPAADVNDIVRFDSFSTRMVVQDDTMNKTLGGVEMLLTATTAVGVYVNNVYRVLNPSTPVRAATDASGSVKLSQPTQDSVAICYKVALASDPSTCLHIDPASKAKSKLGLIRTKQDLKNARIQLDNGTTRRLIPDGVSDQDLEAAAAALGNLATVASSLPQDGAGAKRNREFVWSDSNSKELFNIAPQGDAPTTMAMTAQLPSTVDTLILSAGDLFRSLLNTAWDGLKSFALRVYNGVYQFVVKIGKKIYHAVMDCVAAVFHAVEWVLSTVGVNLDGFKRWLGFVFNWGDILTTQKVLRNIVKTHVIHSISVLGDLPGAVTGTVENLEDQLYAWAKLSPLQHPTTTVGQPANNHAIFKDPQTHYARDKAEACLEEGRAVDDGSANTKTALEKLREFTTREKETLFTFVNEIKTQIIDRLGTLTLMDIIKRLAAIISAVVLDTAKNLAVTSVSLFQSLVSTMLSLLDCPLKIPVLTSLYSTISGGESLSVLNLVCLAAAIPATLLHKAMIDRAPFPSSDPNTAALIAAPDYKTIQAVLSSDKSIQQKVTISPTALPQ